MGTRYFKHLGTDPVRFANGRQVAFKSVDGFQSFLGTQDPEIWAGLEECMRQNRSAVTEVSWGEFESQYLQKKSNAPQLRAPWREEITRGRLMPSPSLLDARLSEQVAAGAVSPPPPPPAPPVIPPSPSALTQVQVVANATIAKELPKAADFKPEVGKRRKAKTP